MRQSYHGLIRLAKRAHARAARRYSCIVMRTMRADKMTAMISRMMQFVAH